MGLTTPKQILPATILPPRPCPGAAMQPISSFYVSWGQLRRVEARIPETAQELTLTKADTAV